MIKKLIKTISFSVDHLLYSGVSLPQNGKGIFIKPPPHITPSCPTRMASNVFKKKPAQCSVLMYIYYYN